MNFVKVDRSVIRKCFQTGKQVCSLGISSFMLQVAVVIAMVIQNKMVVKCGGDSVYGEDIPLAALGVTMKVFSIVTAFVNGLSTGAQPIYGYNYGAGKYDRVKHTFKDVYYVSTVLLCLAFMVFQVCPMSIVSIFGSSDPIYNDFAVKCLKIFLFGLPIAGLQMISGTFFQAMGYPLQSSLVSLSRQIIFLIPLLFFLTALFGINGWSVSWTDCRCLCFCFYGNTAKNILEKNFCLGGTDYGTKKSINSQWKPADGWKHLHCHPGDGAGVCEAGCARGDRAGGKQECPRMHCLRTVCEKRKMCV
jgi:hypothetical protein